MRDHFKHLITKRKRVISQEKRASGIDVELSEIGILLDEIIDDSEAAQEKLEAEEMRKTSMESMGETRKRRAESIWSHPNNSRSLTSRKPDISPTSTYKISNKLYFFHFQLCSRVFIQVHFNTYKDV